MAGEIVGVLRGRVDDLGQLRSARPEDHRMMMSGERRHGRAP
jgi:hypothetical protein